MTRRPHTSTAVALVAFVFVPAILALIGVFGGVAETENRTAAPFPVLWDEPLDTETWNGVDRWLEDRVPFREPAIALERELALGVDNRRAQRIAASAQVLAGVDSDWLFFRDSVHQPCISEQREAQWFDELERVQQIIESSNRRLVIGLAPDRGLVVPEKLGDIDNSCQRSNADVVERLADLTAVENLAEALSGEAHVFRSDTHWNTAGAFAAAQQLVDAIDTDAWSPTNVHTEPFTLLGDLEKLFASETTEDSDMVRFSEDTSPTVERLDGEFIRSATTDATELKVFLGHDSFGGYDGFEAGSTSAYMRPWFSRFDSVHLPADNIASITEEPIRASVHDADVISFLFVQRTLPARLAPGRLSGPLVVALRDELPMSQIDVMAADGARRVAPAGTLVVLDFGNSDARGSSVVASEGAITGRFDHENLSVVTLEPGSVLSVDGPLLEAHLIS